MNGKLDGFNAVFLENIPCDVTAHLFYLTSKEVIVTETCYFGVLKFSVISAILAENKSVLKKFNTF